MHRVCLTCSGTGILGYDNNEDSCQYVCPSCAGQGYVESKNDPKKYQKPSTDDSPVWYAYNEEDGTIRGA